MPMAMAASSSIHPHTGMKRETVLDSQHSFADTSIELTPGLTLSATEQENKENKIENVNKDVLELKEEHTENGEHPTEADESPTIDIVISNVVCTFNLRCHINLKRLAMEGANVEYRREHGILNMKLRRPKVTSNITSSGKVTVTGSTSEAEAKVAARRVARRLQNLGFNVRFFNFRIVNVLGTCSFPFGIKLNNFSNQYPEQASYEPELHPGVTFRIKNPKATLKIFSTGSITITAPCVSNIGEAVEYIYPLVSEFQMEKKGDELAKHKGKKHLHHHRQHAAALNGFHDDSDDDDLEEEEEGFYDSDCDDDSFDSDLSHD